MPDAYIDCEELGLHIINLNTYSDYDDTEMFTLTEDIHLTIRMATSDDLEEEPTDGYNVYFTKGTEIESGQVYYSIDGKQTWHDVGYICYDTSDYYYDDMEELHLVLENVTQIAFKIESCYIESLPVIEALHADASEFGGTDETDNYELDSNIKITARMYYPEED
jgi:hypothetical protein